MNGWLWTLAVLTPWGIILAVIVAALASRRAA